MTRRIALAILLSCWLVLLAGGSASYFAVRRALLEELDASLALRASSLPEVLVAAEGDRGGPWLPPGDRYVIRSTRGRTVASSSRRPPVDRRAELRAAQFATLADGTRVRTVTIALPDAEVASGGEGGAAVMMVTYSGSAERYDRLMGRLWLAVATVGLAAGLLTAGVAVWVARAALRPLRAAANTITSIDERTLDRRLDVSALPEELRPMADRLNQMLARLEGGLRQRKQFIADAAHELRTPVAALMTGMEVALRRPRDAAALTRALQDAVGDVRVLRRLVQVLLEQFKIDAESPASDTQQVDVSAILDLCADGVASSARQKDVTVVRSYEAGLEFPTQPNRLRSVVANLLDNAMEYNRIGGRVELSCELSGDEMTLSVRDTGLGIREDVLPHVFEPFFRGDDARAAEGGGHCGLGLYLVKSHVDALGGTCLVRSTRGSGSEFTIRLPRQPTAGKVSPNPLTARLDVSMSPAVS